MPYQPAGKLRFFDLAKTEAWLREQDKKKKQARRAQQQETAAA
jgi:hypothetical protein